MPGVRPALPFYGVVDDETEQVVEFFPTLEKAEAFIREVRADEPATAAPLRVEQIELEGDSAE